MRILPRILRLGFVLAGLATLAACGGGGGGGGGTAVLSRYTSRN